ncbi:thiol-activated cytolysin family protein [Capnocytophaga sp.]|uniref:thiol-activated cytolysin family protein n=1 Tax=Capnocytophaga sp. TaxID=44737 RepID=UPI0026DC813A|nr:thiol-activated cytolysin family protein [Capnocytophaga sp.]MDO5104363.1 thiol-activated cytolysin family protein [Capnocytophaga sp.]
MKRFILGLLVTTAITAVSCGDKGGDTAQTIEQLKPVVYEKETPKIIASKKTGNVVLDPTTSKNQYEYLSTVQEQYSITPLSIVAETMSDVIYPGSMLRGDSFMKGKYDPLTLRNEFNPVTLSVSLKGDINVSETTKPVLSDVRGTMNALIARQKQGINFDFIPAVFSYESNTVTTEQHFKTSLKIHAEANVMASLVKASFDYQKDESNSLTKSYVMVAFRQHIYNVSIDPKHYSSWIVGDIDVKDMGEYEPLYISSVDYGRVGYIFVETTKSVEEVRKMVKASLEVAVKYVDAQANAAYTKEFQNLFQEGKVRLKISGGPVELANKVDNYESFVKFVQMPNAQNVTETSVPISYKVRRLKDNTEVEVIDTYTHNIIELRDR